MLTRTRKEELGFDGYLPIWDEEATFPFITGYAIVVFSAHVRHLPHRVGPHVQQAATADNLVSILHLEKYSLRV